jgi:hypothetical protein
MPFQKYQFSNQELVMIYEGANSAPEPVVNAVRAAARLTGIAPDKVEVLDVTPVDWPDASLGLPEPGMMYAQMITPGYQVRLRAGDRILVYHTDTGHRTKRAR